MAHYAVRRGGAAWKSTPAERPRRGGRTHRGNSHLASAAVAGVAAGCSGTHAHDRTIRERSDGLTGESGREARRSATRRWRARAADVPLYKEPVHRHGVVFSFASECTCDARSHPPVDVNILVFVSGSPPYIATNRGF